MHVYAFPSESSDLIQYNSGLNEFAVGDIKYITDEAGDVGNVHTLGTTTAFPNYCSRDALVAIIRSAIKTAVNTRYSITVTDDQVTLVGL